MLFRSSERGAPLACFLLMLLVMLLIILIVALVLALGGGGWGHSRYGYAGWSPAGLIVLILVVLWFTGGLRV